MRFAAWLVSMVRRASGAAASGGATSEVDEEFAFHLDALEQELVRSGMPAAEARVRARERFGDVGVLRRRCVEVAMEDRIMVMRINAVLTALLLVAVGVLGWMVVRGNAQQARALEALTARIGTGVPAARMAASQQAALPKPPTQAPGFVYISGGIARAGVYGMEQAGMTLDRLISAAGGAKEGSTKVTVKRGQGPKEIIVAQTTLADLAAGHCVTVLAPDDMVTVE